MPLLKLDVRLPEDDTWVRETLQGRWLSHRHYRLRLGQDGFYGPYLVQSQGKPICIYLPQVLERQALNNLETVFRLVARRRAWSTKRMKAIGNLSTHRNRDGTWSRDPRALRLEMLAEAREGTFGWRGRLPSAFNQHFPSEYARLETFTETVGDLFLQYWPEAYERQMLLCSRRPEYLIGRSPWSQGVCNAEFYMSAHFDENNEPNTWNAEIVLGDGQGGRLIIPRLALGVHVSPGDLLFFSGAELHAVEPFSGRRLSVVWYLRPPKGVR